VVAMHGGFALVYGEGSTLPAAPTLPNNECGWRPGNPEYVGRVYILYTGSHYDALVGVSQGGRQSITLNPYSSPPPQPQTVTLNSHTEINPYSPPPLHRPSRCTASELFPRVQARRKTPPSRSVSSLSAMRWARPWPSRPPRPSGIGYSKRSSLSTPELGSATVTVEPPPSPHDACSD
jgi:hypothetical protein